MTWQNINLKDINPNLEIVPEKTYTFEILPGARYDDRDPGRISVSAAIVNDGEFSGRRMFFSYPDPNVKDWSPRALRRLMESLGVDPEDGEDPVAYLNRVAGNRFSAPVTHSKPTEDYPTPRANLNIFNTKPAA